jgi:hypothetical protein
METHNRERLTKDALLKSLPAERGASKFFDI